MYSPALQREMVWLASLVPYEQAAAIGQRIGGYALAATSIWEQTQRHGERLQAVVEGQRQQVSVERTRWEHRRYDPHARKAVSMDGGMVHVRGEGWKELKVGMVGRLEPAAERDTAVSLHELRYTAVLGEVEPFQRALWALAVQTDIPYAGEVAVTADGAPWIWRLTADCFPCAVQIVDWYHAAQHLAQAAQARFPHDPTQAQTWAEELKGLLFKGEVWKVIARLDAGAVGDHADYFRDHARRMQYAAFRAAGYPIGSGGVESGVKQYKQRLCGPGMRWSRVGVERMVILRSAVLDDTFDQLWTAA